YLGGHLPNPRLEGKSLKPILDSNEDSATSLRDFVISELDYSHRGARLELGLNVNEAKAWMIKDHNWKYIYYLNFPPQLFDLKNDPNELIDLGQDPMHAKTCKVYQDKLFQWHLAGRKIRKTLSDTEVEQRTDAWQKKGVIFGEW
ncbi:MAG: phosphonate monoester hydrolase, partial [Alphaproteobacteria bacterium]|nr:phosphonate monoester hydrolase [Alphaproteobacteria bacterium]